ncbi:MAG TPA: hypothetical protein VJ346_09160 [Bacteroidales bacterium]|nr:hypothetical protein [Bacteroidales bacterium]
MKTGIFKPFIAAMTILMVCLTVSYAQKPKWELLGMRKVNYTLEKDVIPVTWREGSFDAIRIIVRNGSLHMQKCIIHFENGGIKEIELRHNFAGKSASRVIDLPGNNRLIEKIEFWYDTKNVSRQRATVLVYGRH